MAVYAGFPAALNGLFVAKEVLMKEKGNKKDMLLPRIHHLDEKLTKLKPQFNYSWIIILAMKIMLFDLGDTLEYKDQNKDVLMPGTKELLSAVKDMRDHKGDTPALALVSDFNNDKPAEEYYSLLQTLGIDTFFKPLKQRVTLSQEIGVMKPDERIFQAAIVKISKDLSYQNVIFDIFAMYTLAKFILVHNCIVC